MHDRVAELLAERARIGGGAGGGIALSVLLHGSIAAAVIYAAMHASVPQQVSTLNIQFAQVASPQPVTAPTPPPAAAPVAPKLKIPEPVAEAPKPIAKAEPKTVPFSNFGKSAKKGSEKPPAPVPHAAPPTPAPAIGIASNIDIPTGATGVTGLDADFPYTIYIERMKSLIGQRWLRPQVGNGTVATVSFTIDRDGAIRDAKGEISSGNGTFDRAALRAVLEASPLPPLPYGYNGTYLGVHLTFR
ncbi:MAG: periplasmic protein TonB [Thermoanaerobaculia bacterium]|jgi:TonB family protein|nr:periplasmic protein TonB [Thermoanaerobaculia bacterium]